MTLKNKRYDMSNFEINFANKFSATHAFSFWKARVALYAMLKALGVGADDEIILPGYTCVMDVNPIKYLGAKPVYVDIEPVTYNMDVALLEQKITDRTKVIIAQHTYGYPCEMDAIMNIADKHGLPVIDDCCLAFGPTYKGKLCGTFGKAAYFSFQWNKPFTTGLGGMCIVNDQNLANRIETLCRNEMCSPSAKASVMLAIQRMVYRTIIYPRTTAMATSLFRWLTKKGLVVGSSGTCEFAPEMADDFFMAMGAAQGRSGLRQLKKLDKNIAHRRKMRTVYDQLLTEAGFDIPQLTIPDYMDPVLVRYPVRVADKEKALAEAPTRGVEVGSWFECPLHPIETPMHLYDYEQGMCPVAEKACREVVNLPTHPRAGVRTAKRTVEFIRQIGPA